MSDFMPLLSNPGLLGNTRGVTDHLPMTAAVAQWETWYNRSRVISAFYVDGMAREAYAMRSTPVPYSYFNDGTLI